MPSPADSSDITPGWTPDFTPGPGFTHLYSGKVRDLWSTPSGDVLFVATDRISAFDYILPTPIPDKGKILTQMSLWWGEQLAPIVEHHVLSTDVPDSVSGRAVVCRKLDMFPVECVARGYLTGSGLVDYRATGAVCGIALPPGLEEASRLPHAIFTPATKAAVGDHDENIDFSRVEATIGAGMAERLRDLTMAVYARADELARDRGLIVADTKLEFGRDPNTGRVVLGDEILTPDSSRFWPASDWVPGRTQESFDKQIVRNWLLSADSGWSKASGEPPPELPDSVVDRTRERYIEAFERLTGQVWR